MKNFVTVLLFSFLFLQNGLAQLGNAPPPIDLARTAFNHDIFDAQIVEERTGFTSVCVGCEIEEADCLVNKDCERRFGPHFNITTGVVNTGSISIMVSDTVFPAGTYAGWAHYYEGGILAISWDISTGPLSIATFLDGEFQEGREVANRDMAVGLGIFTTTEFAYVELKTTKPFNEIQVIVDFGVVSNIEFARIASVYVGVPTDRDGDGVLSDIDDDDDDPCTPNQNSIACLSGGALAIEMADFQAIAVKNGVQLNWSMLHQQQVQHFEMERFDPTMSDFSTIGTIALAKNSDTKNYQFLDPIVQEGNYQYRVKTVQKDGKTHFSPIRSIQVFDPDKPPVQILQNPVRSGNYVDILIHQAAQIKVFDARGQFLRQDNYPTIGHQQLGLGGLNAGLYYLQIESRNEFRIEKIVVVD